MHAPYLQRAKAPPTENNELHNDKKKDDIMNSQTTKQHIYKSLKPTQNQSESFQEQKSWFFPSDSMILITLTN